MSGCESCQREGEGERKRGREAKKKSNPNLQDMTCKRKEKLQKTTLVAQEQKKGQTVLRKKSKDLLKDFGAIV